MLAQIIGIIGTVVLLLSFQTKTKRVLYFMQASFSVIYLIHFILLKQPMGALMQIVAFTRCMFLFVDNKFTKSKASLILLSALTIALGVYSYDGLISLFPALALFTSTIVMWFSDIKSIKRWQFFCFSPFWIIYDITVGSYSGIVTELLAMASVVTFWVRIRKEKKNHT